MMGKMIQIEYEDVNQEYGINQFENLLLAQGVTQHGSNAFAIFTHLIIRINNAYSLAGYRYIFETPEYDARDYADVLFRYICAVAVRKNMTYLRFFFDEKSEDVGSEYKVIPVYQRLMRKTQTGSDNTSGSSSVNLKNSNSPINADAEVINPTSKSNSSSSSNSSITYNNTTDYDNINETERRNYYEKLENAYTWLRKNLVDPLVYEFQVNNA